MHTRRSLVPAMAVLALLGTTAAWSQGVANNTPSVTTGWQRVQAADALGGDCYMIKNRSAAASASAAWTLQAPAAGNYQVQVYVPPVTGLGAVTQSATYLVSTPHGPAVKNGIDQSLSGWQTIGTFRMGKGPVTVTLNDRTGEPNDSHWVVANAARLQVAGAPSDYAATLAASNLSLTAVAGDVVTFTINLTNTGTQIWYRDPAPAGQAPVRLALTQGPAAACDASLVWEPGFGWLPRARNRVLLDTARVAPGETGSFLFTIQLAQNLPAGTYTYHFQPVAEPNGGTAGGVMSSDITATITVSGRLQTDLDFSQLQLYRANLSAHTANSDGDKLVDLFLPTDRSPTGALAYAKTQVDILGLTDHGEELSPAEWAGQADATATATATGSSPFVGLRGFKWSGTTGPHDFFGFPWEGSSTDVGHLSIFGTSTWTGTRAVLDGAPPQLAPQFIAAPTPDTTLSGQPTSLADWLWVFGYPRPNAVDNGVSPAQFNHPSLFFRGNFFQGFQYQADLDRFFNLMEVGSGEVRPGSVQAELAKGADILASQISDEGGYRYLGPDTPAAVANHPPDELLSLPASALAALGHPEDSSKWGTNPNNQNRLWFETALRNGWHVAPSINGDNHAGCYCDDSGYTGVWAKPVTGQSAAQAQATILQAIRERAVFASDDAGLSAQFSVFSSGVQYRMGQRNVPQAQSLHFRLDLASRAVSGNPADVAVQDVFIVGSGGATRIGGGLTGATKRIEADLPGNLAAGQEQFFYALVVSTRKNERGENLRLLTAPIWMSACGCTAPTCKVWPNEGKLPAGACAVIGFMSQNGTSATLQIDNGTPIDVPLTGTLPIFPSQLNPNLSLHTVTFRVTGPCGVSVCSVQITCGPPPNLCQTGAACAVNVSPDSGDCTTQFTATWNTASLSNTHLLLDGTDLGPVPAIGSKILPSPGNGTHTLTLAGDCQGIPNQCQTMFTVCCSTTFPSCRNSVMPSAGFLDTRFDLCYFAGNAVRVDVFVDGVLKCTQLNPVPGQQYNCFVLGSEVGPGLHIASIIAMDSCGKMCTKGTLFRVFDSNAGK